MSLSAFTLVPEQVITTDKYLEIAQQLGPSVARYEKTDSFYRCSGYHWRGRSIDSILSATKTKVLITGHSDWPISIAIYDRFATICDVWAGINMDLPSTTMEKNIIKLPLGITNCTNESPEHAIFGNIEIMKEVADLSLQKSKTIYLNFNIGNNPGERQIVYNMFSKFPFVTVDTPKNTLEGRKHYLKSIAQHEFVLCPAGNGTDTHRLWETLYMRSIPIVKNHQVFSNFHDLPIYFVDDWGSAAEKTKEDWDRIYQDMSEQVWNLQKLEIHYWRKVFAAHGS
jgi:hypothetical protein